MNHSQLVLAATELLSEVRNVASWLPVYDRALASNSDRELVDLVFRLRSELFAIQSIAA
jgi:hypothetical protein